MTNFGWLGGFDVTSATMPQHERPLSERFRLAGLAWAEAEAKADLVEKMRDPTLEAMKNEKYQQLTDAGEKKIPEATLERIVKGSPEWGEYIAGMCHARELANKAWVERRAIELQMSEMIDGNANARTERRMA